MIHNSAHKTPIKAVNINVLLILLVVCLFISVTALAQNEIESKPTAETEIICYAAQKKWVCAPADQKQQAHDKAMKLVQQKQSLNIDVDSIGSQVEIKTMDVNTDFNQQVQEVPSDEHNQPSVTEAQIKDFLPQDGANDLPAAETESSSKQEVLSETIEDTEVQQSNQPVTTSPSKNEADDLLINPVRQTIESNDFEYWQNNYPEKWSFQVIGTSNRHQLDQFINTHDLVKSNYSIVKTQVKGANWWVVLVGLYASRDQALSQRNQLPSDLAIQAWVRQVKTIIGEAD